MTSETLESGKDESKDSTSFESKSDCDLDDKPTEQDCEDQSDSDDYEQDQDNIHVDSASMDEDLFERCLKEEYSASQCSTTSYQNDEEADGIDGEPKRQSNLKSRHYRYTK